MRGGGLKLLQGRVAGNFFSERVLRYWHSCPGRWWSPSLKVFKNRVDVALRDVVSGHGGDGGWTG